MTRDQIIEGKLYQFGSNGVWNGQIHTLTSGWKLIDGQYYYYRNGEAVQGLQTIGGLKYYFDPVKRCMLYYQVLCLDDGDAYFIGRDGAIVTKSGWYSLYNRDTYVDADHGEYVYVGTDGKLINGLKTIGRRTYYFSQYRMVSRTNKLSVDGCTLYVIAANGVVTQKPAASNAGWKKFNGKWYYSDGTVYLTGYQVIEGKAYYFDAIGTLAVNKAIYRGKGREGSRYLIAGSDGVLQSDGWVGDRYLSNGYPLKGICQMGGKHYYFPEHWGGASLKGVFNWNGTWYYYDGRGARIRINMKNGLNDVYDQLIYIIPGQPFHHGVFKANESYYFNDSGWYDGKLFDSRVVTSGFAWSYYADRDGKLVKGWKKIRGYWYYFDSNYEYVTGVQTIDGKQYLFDTDGRMIP